MILYLPGYSPRNKEEGQHIVDTLAQNNLEVYYHQWPHWTDESAKFDAYEQAKILAAKFQDEAEMNIVAKSIGTLVAALAGKNLKVNKMILLGIPFNDLDERDIKAYQQLNYPKSLTIIHNELDHHGSWQQVQKLLQGLDYEVIVKTGVDNHWYDYPQDVLNTLLAND